MCGCWSAGSWTRPRPWSTRPGGRSAEEVGLAAADLTYFGSEGWGLNGTGVLLALFTARVADPAAEPVVDGHGRRGRFSRWTSRRLGRRPGRRPARPYLGVDPRHLIAPHGR